MSESVERKLAAKDIWAEIKRHPGVYLLIFLLSGLPIYIATLWGPFMGSKPIPEWLSENGWPRLRWLVAGWGVAALIIASVIVVRSWLKATQRVYEPHSTKRDFLVARLHELVRETDEFERSEQGPLSDFRFHVGIGNSIEQFLGLYSAEWVTRFQQKRVLALHEIIKELLDGTSIPEHSQPVRALENAKPETYHRVALEELEKEYEVKKLEPSVVDMGNEYVPAYNDDKGVIVRGLSPDANGFHVLVRSFGNQHPGRKVRSLKRVSFRPFFICHDRESRNNPDSGVRIHRGAWLSESEIELDFPPHCPPRRAVIVTVEGAENHVYAIRRDSDSTYKGILPVREELTGRVYTLVFGLLEDSQNRGLFTYILEIIREPSFRLNLSEAKRWKSGI